MAPLISLIAAFLFVVTQAFAAPPSGEHLTVEWVSPEVLSRSEPNTLGILFKPEPGWHIYWKNPGDSGAAPKFALSATGATLGEILWPSPTRIAFGDLTNLGYKGETVFPFELTATQESVRLEARLEWLVCKEDCIPGFGTLWLERKTRAGAPEWKKENARRIAEVRRRIPRPPGQAPWSVERGTRDGGRLRVYFAAIGEMNTSTALPEVFPVDGSFLSPKAPEYLRHENGFDAVFEVSEGASGVAEATKETGRFVLVGEGGESWEVASAPIGENKSALWLLLLGAFVGGMILNLMPCVFPVLSIKLASLLSGLSGHASAQARMREGLAYTLGVLSAFSALGGLFLALRHAGTSVGWGFQLQLPSVVLSLALLFWLMGLSFLGVFEFGARLMKWAGTKSPGGSSFATGVLSVIVATPCTGPFMGTALGAAATLPAVHAMGIFLGLGAGLAAPFLALSVFPALTAKLPKPGQWMELLKQALAFPLFATVIWLFWVLGEQVGPQGWLMGSVLLFGVAFAIWLGKSFSGKKTRALAWGVALLTIALSYGGIREDVESAWLPYDAGELSRARAEGKPVFVDFTAAWCITCQWNKKAVLDKRETLRLFRNHGVVLFRADWTNEDPKITAALSELGRSSVPVYVFYEKGVKEPVILPQILTYSILRELFEP